MAEACGAETSMDAGAFGAHIEELAIKFKDKVANLAAITVQNDANAVQEAITSQMSYEHENAMWEWQRDGSQGNPPPYPTKGADKGYEYLVGTGWDEIVDDYKTNYELDLLSIDSGSVNDIENELKNVHLTWIPELFSRAGSIPKPSNGEDAISTLNTVGGADSLIEVSTNGDGGLDVGEADATALGGSTIGSAAEADTATVVASVESWHSGTAKVFKQHFVPKIPVAAAHQVNVTTVLRNFLGLHSRVIELARSDIDSLAHTAVEAAESFDDCCGGGNDAQVWLGLAGAVLTIVGAGLSFASAGTSLALVSAGVSMLSGSVSLAKSIESAQPEPTELGGGTIDEIVENVRTKIEKIFTDLDEGYSEIGSGLDSIADLCSGSKVLVAPRPEGANGETGFGDYGPDDVSDVTD